jgi:hypothetical protein
MIAGRVLLLYPPPDGKWWVAKAGQILLVFKKICFESPAPPSSWFGKEKGKER